MYFEGLRRDYQAHLTDLSFKIENKQRLNISDHAYTVVLNDKTAFQHDKFAVQQSVKATDTSSFFNVIIRNFREIAESSIAHAMSCKEAEYDGILSPLGDTAPIRKAIVLLVSDYEAMLIKRTKEREKNKGHALTFRIDSENIAFLASDEAFAEAKYYNGDITPYLKAIIEEYAEHQYFEREHIYFKHLINQVYASIADKKIMKITFQSTNLFNGNHAAYFKPLSIQQDSEMLYNYIVGFISTDKKEPWNGCSIRLTSIKSCEKLEQPAFISTDKQSGITRKIHKNGVQYLSASVSSEIVVQFTKEGERLYQRMLHLRPMYTAKNISEGEQIIYKFDCTVDQAENYFFKFGHNVKILEPEYLAEKFERKYSSAAKIYQKQD